MSLSAECIGLVEAMGGALSVVCNWEEERLRQEAG